MHVLIIIENLNNKRLGYVFLDITNIVVINTTVLFLHGITNIKINLFFKICSLIIYSDNITIYVTQIYLGKCT